MGLLFYSWFVPLCESSLRTVSTGAYCFSLFGLLPCVRVRCGLYPHGLTDLLFLVCSQVRESVADCIHMGSLIYSFWYAPCVRVHCGLHPYGLTVLLLVCSLV